MKKKFSTKPEKRVNSVSSKQKRVAKKNNKKSETGKKMPEKQPKEDNKSVSFGERLAAVRKQKAVTQERMEQLTGFDKRMISRWEGGKTRPGIDAAVTLAKALGVSLDALTGLNQAGDPVRVELILLTQKLNTENLKAVLFIVKAMVR